MVCGLFLSATLADEIKPTFHVEMEPSYQARNYGGAGGFAPPRKNFAPTEKMR